MIDPTPRPRESFDAIIQSEPDPPAPPAPRRHGALAAMTIVFALLGACALGAAALTGSATGAAPAPTAGATGTPTGTQTGTQTGTAAAGATASQAAPSTPSATPARPAPTAPTASAAKDRPLAELADPAWVASVARAGAIPERALAAYAGAALATAETHPGCGIGWNTLAAIGLVESEHGSINGASLGADGWVTPAVIGLPTGADTDGGQLDGDAAQDHAVGPMQFIPSTWALAAQDGNRDGKADVNQIDDAALAAAAHLCDVGQDLTDAANWIAAIGAYNPAVEYNNRVADAANHYATLR